VAPKPLEWDVKHAIQPRRLGPGLGWLASQARVGRGTFAAGLAAFATRTTRTTALGLAEPGRRSHRHQSDPSSSAVRRPFTLAGGFGARPTTLDWLVNQ